MSQKSAAWNLAVQTIPAVGLVFVFLAPLARVAPLRFFFASAALSMIGLCLFLAAKTSLFRQGRYSSWGSKDMSTWNRRAYRTGHALMICGIVSGIVFTAVWQAR